MPRHQTNPLKHGRLLVTILLLSAAAARGGEDAPAPAPTPVPAPAPTPQIDESTAAAIGGAILDAVENVTKSVERAKRRGSGRRFVIEDFPYQWIAVGDPAAHDRGVRDGFEVEVIRYDTDMRPARIPFRDDRGRWLWDAMVCVSPRCPHLAEMAAAAKDEGGEGKKTNPAAAGGFQLRDPGREAERGFKFPNLSRRHFEQRLAWARDGYPDIDDNTPLAERTRFEEVMNQPPQCPRCVTLPDPEFMAVEYYDAEGRAKLDELRAEILRETRR